MNTIRKKIRRHNLLGRLVAGVEKINPGSGKVLSVLIIFNLLSPTIFGQVPVREEPMHVPVLQNKYVRLLDVWLKPGDTTMYHIHATPSLFIYLSSTVTGSQIKGEGWGKDRSETGKVWYRSFTPDTLVHRVANLDTSPFHVNDIEILSAYRTTSPSPATAMPFKLVFENEKALAYRLAYADLTNQIIKDRGPIIAELATGNGIIFHDAVTGKTKEIKAGNYLYIEPGASFYFSAPVKVEIDLVLFEIK